MEECSKRECDECIWSECRICYKLRLSCSLGSVMTQGCTWNVSNLYINRLLIANDKGCWSNLEFIMESSPHSVLCTECASCQRFEYPVLIFIWCMFSMFKSKHRPPSNLGVFVCQNSRLSWLTDPFFCNRSLTYLSLGNGSLLANSFCSLKQNGKLWIMYALKPSWCVSLFLFL